MKRLLALCVVLLPWALKRRLLVRFWRYQLAPNAYIGLSYIFPRHLVMGERASIGHFNVAIHLDRVECGADSVIARSNWITGHPKDGAYFSHRPERDPALILGAHAAILKKHIIDCTDRIEIGAFTIVAGYHSQLITHGINVNDSRQDCKPIRIGSYCLLGTRVTVIGGAVLPDGCVLGAAALLNRAHDTPYSLYAGQPAERRKALDPEAAYFHRRQGYVD